jgi:deoxyribonuclease V
MPSWRWPETGPELEEAQTVLAELAYHQDPWLPPRDRLLIVAGTFIAYRRGVAGMGAAGDPAWVGAALFEGSQLIEARIVTGTVGAPYIPGLLALREGPILERGLGALAQMPDIVLVNATGRDHPRRAGLAVHLGAVLDLPTVGVTDRPLTATADPDGRLILDGEVVGYLVETRSRARPVVVHAGWRTSTEAAREVVLAVTASSRTPEPIRKARQLAREARTRSETSARASGNR